MIDLSSIKPDCPCERCDLIRTIDTLARALAYARGYGPWDAESRRWLREKYGVDYGRETWNGAADKLKQREEIGR